MKDFIDLMRRWTRGLIEILGFFPILLNIGLLLIPEETRLWFFFLALIYLLGIILAKHLKGKPRYLYLLTGLFIVLSLGYWLSETVVALVLMILSGIIAFYRGLILSFRPWDKALPSSALWLGMVAYLILGAIYSLVPSLKGYLSYIAWPGIIYTVICLFTVNTMHLREASFKDRGGGGISPSVIRNNRLLVLLSLGLIIVISNFKVLRDSLKGFFRGIIWSIVKFVNFISELLFSSEGVSDISPESGPMDILPIESGKSHWIWEVLEKAALVVALILMSVLLYFGFRALYRLILKLYRYIRGLLKERVSFEEDAGFVDEKESLVSFKEAGRDYLDRLQEWIRGLRDREPKWEDLKDNGERVRFLYRRTILRAIEEGYSFKYYLSPKETGRDLSEWMGDRDYEFNSLVQNYDRVRYGYGGIDEEEVEKLKRHFIDKPGKD